MLSESRISELLDYATNYGEFDENTPIGTFAVDDSTVFMTIGRRHALVTYKKVLGLLPIDFLVDDRPSSAKKALECVVDLLVQVVVHESGIIGFLRELDAKTPVSEPELLPKDTRTLAGDRVHFSGEIEGSERDRLVEQAAELGATVLPFPEPNCYIVHGKSPRICDEWMLSHCMPVERWQELIERRQGERAPRYWPTDPNERRAHGDPASSCVKVTIDMAEDFDMDAFKASVEAKLGLRMSELGLTEKPASLNAYIDAQVDERSATLRTAVMNNGWYWRILDE